MIFARRHITISLDGSKAGKSSHVLTGHRTSCSIHVAGLPAQGFAHVSIYGMKLSVMNELATYGQPIQAQGRVKITIEAGDDVNGMSTVFIGEVTQAWADFQAMPQVPFQIQATSAGVPVVQRSDGGNSDFNSYSGATDVGQMVQKLSSIMGYQYENGGVNLKLSNPYHYGSPLRQLQHIMQAADIMSCVELGTVAIWPLNQSRPGGDLVVSKETGMVAYPSFTENGIMVRVEFTRYARYGTAFTVQSDITPATGREWSIIQADYNLESLVPKGRWFVDLYGSLASANIPYPPKL